MLWSRRAASHELRAWRARADAIPDASIRADALDAIIRKHDNAEGAALFTLLPKRRNRDLLKLLVAYQVMWDFLDSASERGACNGPRNGFQLHRALVEALDPRTSISDYYMHHVSKDDGGFLLQLVETCRALIRMLPCYCQISELILDGVERCSVQSLNHEPDPHARDAALRAWAGRAFSSDESLRWFELTAAASAYLPYALLALAAEPSCDASEANAVNSAYFPWVSLAVAMLDSYVDRTEDATGDNHSYISHYRSESLAVVRLRTVIGQALARVAHLRKGRRHTIIVASMVAMYLAKEGANTSRLRKQTRSLVRAGGWLTMLLLPAAYAWRTIRIPLPTARTFDVDLPPGAGYPRAVQTFVFWRAPFAYYRRRQYCQGNRFTLRATSHPPMVFFADPSQVRAMMAAPADVLHPGEGGHTIAPIVGTSSFMLQDEDEHLFGRKAVLPTLRRSAVEADVDRMIGVARSVTGSWPRHVSMALHPRLRALTLEILLRRIFAGGGAEANAARRLLMDRVLSMLAITSRVVLPLPVLRRGPGWFSWARFVRQRAEVDALIHGLIDERLEADGEGEEGDALATLLAARDESGEPMSRMQLRDNVMSLILAGHETTASQLAWAFQLLAHNPRVQRRLIEEIDRATGESYMMATIQEVLRLRPVFLFTIPRAVKQPIEIGGWTYRPPAHLLGCIYLLHHDADVYPEPEVFRPERFLEGQPSPYTYLPWGGGRRRCPGSHLALLEMKTVLRAVLETVSVAPASRRMERPRWRSVIVTPHAGSRVVLRPRERGASVLAPRRGTAAGACGDAIRTKSLV